MKFSIFVMLLAMMSSGFIYYVCSRFDYEVRDNDLKKISAKVLYINPSFNFKSKEYREFVYAK